ncbi:restriction endonuclease [Halobacillus mangrovi]|uniref:Restriction endonuclease type IV Mrr domain-containing protein n=1 Tax=Halobacillus mangrovi TaxID=402384 RepID=A0A1W5ZZW6_9BACI|nr:restriction endonuclease [Halobacillus mangrovi]ARI78802.1 hypothetical protein HM131_19030 [Halobacillus mangrovi]
MWGFFRKNSQKDKVEEKKSKYQIEKNRVLNLAKSKFTNFKFDYEFVSIDLNNCLFLDDNNNLLGIYKKERRDYYQEEQIHVISFKDVKEFGLSIDSKEIGLCSEPELFLAAEDNIDDLMNRVAENLTEEVTYISFYFLKRGYVNTSETIHISLQEAPSQNSIQEDVKQLFRTIAEYMLVGEAEYLKELEENNFKKDMEDLGERIAYLDKNYSELTISPLLVTDLIKSWEFLVEELNFESNYKVNFESLELLGVRDSVLYLACKTNMVETFNLKQIKTLLAYIFKKYGAGFFDILIVSNEEKLDKISIEDEPQILEQINREIDTLIEWNVETLEEGIVRNYRKGNLFIDYDGDDLDNVRQLFSLNKELLSKLVYILTGNLLEEIFCVNSSDKIDMIQLDRVDEIWKCVIQNVCRKSYGIWHQDLILSSKVHLFKDNLFYVYFNNRNNLTYLDYDLRKEINNNLHIITGIKNIDIEIITCPERVDEKRDDIPKKILNWIKELKEYPYTNFEMIDARESNKTILIFVDEKLYVQPVSDLNIEYNPRSENLMKKSLQVYTSLLPKRMFIEGIEFNYDSELVDKIDNYLNKLDHSQQLEMNEIKDSIINNPKTIDLLRRFYNKEISNFFRPIELDELQSGNHYVEESIQKFVSFLLEKGYINRKKYLVNHVVRNLIVEEAEKAISAEFFNQNQEEFKHYENMSLDDCLNTYLTLDFANIESIDHVASFTCFLIDKNKFSEEQSFTDSNHVIYELLHNKYNEYELNNYEEYLLSDNDLSNDKTIEKTDVMDGYQFESFIADLFRRMGYQVEVTKGSGDYGIDVIAKKKGLSIGIQTKCYSNNVPNKAVQEAIAGVSYYRLDKGMVITNHYFTKQARNQAANSNILLWDRNILNQKIHEVYESNL